MNDPKKKHNLNDVVHDLDKAKEVAEIGRAVPGGAVFVDEADLGIETAQESIGIFKKLKDLFKKKHAQ